MEFSPEQNFVIINYHYVENPRADAPGIYPCSVNEFERQVAFLSRHFSIVSVPDLFEAAQRNENKKLCAITFDDGLKDQYEHAVPVLKTYHATAAFFIITGTFAGMLPLAYKIHILLSRMPIHQVAAMVNKFLSDSFPLLADQYRIPSDRRLVPDRRLHEDTLSANVKETLIMIPRDVRNAFFDMALKVGQHTNEKEICNMLFMNEKEIAGLERDGFTIGSHTHQHESLEHKDETFLRDEIRASTDIFSRFLGTQPTIISYPHGRSNKTTWRVLAESGFTYGATIERRGLNEHDTPFLIPRFDTMDVKVFLDKSGEG